MKTLQGSGEWYNSYTKSYLVLETTALRHETFSVFILVNNDFHLRVYKHKAKKMLYILIIQRYIKTTPKIIVCLYVVLH